MSYSDLSTFQWIGLLVIYVVIIYMILIGHHSRGTM